MVSTYAWTKINSNSLSAMPKREWPDVEVYLSWGDDIVVPAGESKTHDEGQGIYVDCKLQKVWSIRRLITTILRSLDIADGKSSLVRGIGFLEAEPL